MLQRIHRTGEAGSALILVLVAVLAVAALAASFLRMSSAVTRRQAQAVEMEQALYLAEAGLSEAFAGVAIGKSGSVGSVDDPAVFGSGLFWVESTDVDDDLIQLDATGMAGTARTELSSVVQRGNPSVASLGVFADGALVVQPGTLVDGYNSDELSYEDADPDELATFAGGRLGSNGAITLSGTPEAPSIINGDVTAGPNLSVAIGADVTVTGETGASYLAVELPQVELPSLSQGPAITHGAGTPLVIQPGETAMEGLKVLANAEVQIVGPATLLLGSLDVKAGGKLLFDNAQGTIEIFVDGDVSLEGGSLVETTDLDPARLSIQVSGRPSDPVQLFAAGQFHGVLYAPQADVELANPFEVFGALIGKNVTFTGPVRLHFDEGLLDDATATSLPTLVSWRILEMSTAPGAAPGASPFQILGVDPTLLSLPSDAHADQLLEVSYLDAGGAFRIWQGQESAFDWSTVSAPLFVSRAGVGVPRFERPRSVADTAAAADPLMQALLDGIATASSSAEVRQLLLDNAPVDDQVLTTALKRNPPLTSTHLAEVLAANAPLSDGVLGTMLVANTMASADVLGILQSQASVSTPVLLGAVGSKSLTSADLRTILVK